MPLLQPVLSSFSKPALKPRYLVAARGNLKTQVNGSERLVRDEAAKAKEFDLISCPSSHERHDAIQTFLIPFGIEFSEDFRDEELKPREKRVTKMVGICDVRSMWRTVENRPNCPTYLLLRN
jgi:hypothetical protein